MIVFIIGVIIFVFIVRGIAFTRFYIVKKKQKPKGSILGAATSALILLFIFIPFSFHTVNADEVAVVKHLCKAEKVRTAGTYFDF